MAQTIDTLGYVKRLREAGIADKQAEAHAEAIRDFVMPELATKADIVRLEHQIERQTLTLTVRLGGLIILGVGALAALVRLL
jgi:hypothetical protein